MSLNETLGNIIFRAEMAVGAARQSVDALDIQVELAKETKSAVADLEDRLERGLAAIENAANTRPKTYDVQRAYNQGVRDAARALRSVLADGNLAIIQNLMPHDPS